MEGLSNSYSTVTQLWNRITLRNPEDGDDTLSETYIRTRATRDKVPEGIHNWLRRQYRVLCQSTIIKYVGSYKSYMAWYPRRRHSSQSPPWKRQILCIQIYPYTNCNRILMPLYSYSCRLNLLFLITSPNVCQPNSISDQCNICEHSAPLSGYQIWT
jgi:hypothetical protein